MDYTSDIGRVDLLSGNETRLPDDDDVVLPLNAEEGALVYVARDPDEAITCLLVARSAREVDVQLADEGV